MAEKKGKVEALGEALKGMGAKSVTVNVMRGPGTPEENAQFAGDNPDAMAHFGGLGSYLSSMYNLIHDNNDSDRENTTAKIKAEDPNYDPLARVPMYSKGGSVGMASGGFASGGSPAVGGPALPVQALANAYQQNGLSNANNPSTTPATPTSVAPTIAQATGQPVNDGGAVSDGSVGAPGAAGSTGGGAFGGAIGAAGAAFGGAALGALGLGALGSTAFGIGSQAAQAAYQNNFSNNDSPPVSYASAIASAFPGNSLFGWGTSVADQMSQNAFDSPAFAATFGPGVGQDSSVASSDSTQASFDSPAFAANFGPGVGQDGSVGLGSSTSAAFGGSGSSSGPSGVGGDTGNNNFGGDATSFGPGAGSGLGGATGDGYGASGTGGGGTGTGADAGGGYGDGGGGDGGGGDGDGGGDGGGGGWIICTELMRQGRMPKKYWATGSKRFSEYPEYIKLGYYSWAEPSVAHIKRNPYSIYSKFLCYIFNYRAEDIAAKANVRGAKRRFMAKIIEAALQVICNAAYFLYVKPKRVFHMKEI